MKTAGDCEVHWGEKKKEKHNRLQMNKGWRKEGLKMNHSWSRKENRPPFLINNQAE